MFHSLVNQAKESMDRATPKPESREQVPPIHSVSNQSRLQRLQRRADQNAEPVTVPPIVHEELRAASQPLEAGTRASMEPRFGVDFSPVRVHTGARAAESAQAVNALAYTVGQDIVFGEGQYAPHTNEGQRTLAHELTHTIQQGPGLQRIPNRLEVSSPADASEREATAVAESVINGGGDTGTDKQSPGQGLPTAPTYGTTPVPMDAGTPAKKKVTVNFTSLADSTGSTSSTITYANTQVYNQANIEVVKGKEATIDATKSKTILGNDLVLDEYTSSASPTVEEKALVKENQSAGAITVYFVKELSRGSLGEDFRPGQGNGLLGVIAGNKNTPNTVCHELGHVLLDDGGHVVPDGTYLMHADAENPTKLTADQITKMRASTFVK